MLGVKKSTSSICTTKKTAASQPSFTAATSSSMCFTARSLGASGKRTTPSSSRVTPFTSMRTFRSPVSAYRSILEFPKVYSGLRKVRPGRKARPSSASSSHSRTRALGIWESILMRRSPFHTEIRSHFVFLWGLSDFCTQTLAPGTRSSAHRPVFFTWTVSLAPSIST